MRACICVAILAPYSSPCLADDAVSRRIGEQLARRLKRATRALSEDEWAHLKPECLRNLRATFWIGTVHEIVLRAVHFAY